MHSFSRFFRLAIASSSFCLAVLAFLALPAQAHHALGGRLPANGWEGFLSGLAHPVIGLDHLAFVVAIGLLAAIQARRLLIPGTFLLAALAGTGLHLLRLDLPASEVFIAASVLLVGLLLAVKASPNVGLLVGLAAIAGLFHGYAYGEAIVGAEMSSLLTYLLGFTVIQFGVAMAAYWAGRQWLNRRSDSDRDALPLRFAGFSLCGAGVVFLSAALLP
jgi:urease accessory protein